MSFFFSSDLARECRATRLLLIRASAMSPFLLHFLTPPRRLCPLTCGWLLTAARCRAWGLVTGDHRVTARSGFGADYRGLRNFKTGVPRGDGFCLAPRSFMCVHGETAARARALLRPVRRLTLLSCPAEFPEQRRDPSSSAAAPKCRALKLFPALGWSTPLPLSRCRSI